jgi:D-arabinose 1-dehydrogenase-like Zn-dependent alcohol dehydrogenase
MVSLSWKNWSGFALPNRAKVSQHEEIVGARATTKQELQETMDLVAQGRLQPIIDRIFPLEDIELAFEALRQGNSLGRNVVAV